MTGADSGRGPRALARSVVAALAAMTALAGCEAGRGVDLAAAAGGPPDLARPPSGVSASQYGMRLLNDNQPDLALKAFGIAMVKEGASLQTLAGIGAANVRLGRLRQARKILIRANEIYPDSPVLRNNLGVVLYDLRDYESARQQFRIAFALSDGAEAEIEHNIGIAQNGVARMEALQPRPVFSPYTVVPLGYGQFFLLKQGEASL